MLTENYIYGFMSDNSYNFKKSKYHKKNKIIEYFFL